MNSWKRYHEDAAIVSKGKSKGGNIVGAVLSDTYNPMFEKIIVMDEQFEDLVRNHQIQNFEFDADGQLIISYNQGDIDYIQKNFGISKKDLDELIKNTSCVAGWLSNDLVFHKKLVHQFMKSKNHVGLGRYIAFDDICAAAKVYFKSVSDANKFIDSCEPGIIDIVSQEENILILSILNLIPIKNELLEAGVIIY